MKQHASTPVLTLTAVFLIVGNIVIRWPAHAREEEKAEVPGGVKAQSPAVAQTRQSAPPIKPPPAKPAFDWAPVESADYKTYMANLRSLGFPEELIREIVIADINKLYEPRETPLKQPFIPQDAPAAQRQHLASDEELEQARQLRAIEIEKQSVLKELLGIDVPRPLIRTPTARNYEAYAYALNLLPPDKRDATQMIEENEFLEDDVNKRLPRREYVEAYRQRREQRNAELNQVLTPDEFQLFERNSTPAATELMRRTIGMEPTEKEASAMIDLAFKQWVETGGVYGLWRANPVPPGQIAAANQRFDEGLKEALGPDRYVDYRMAASESGQQLNNLGNRYGLARESLRDAFRLQVELDGLDKAAARYGPAANAPQTHRAELEQSLEQTLSPEIMEAWTRGRNQRYDLQP